MPRLSKKVPCFKHRSQAATWSFLPESNALTVEKLGYIRISTSNRAWTPLSIYKGPRPIEGLQSIKNISIYYFISMAFEDALGSLPIIEQPKVRLPRRVPHGRAFVGSSSGCPDKTGLTGPTCSCNGAARCAPAHCTLSTRYLVRHVFALARESRNLHNIETGRQQLLAWLVHRSPGQRWQGSHPVRIQCVWCSQRCCHSWRLRLKQIVGSAAAIRKKSCAEIWLGSWLV
jgi:hypothetical protein